MTNNGYDPKYVKRCRRKARFENVKYTLFWAVPLAILLIISVAITYVIYVKTTWQNFAMCLAADISYAEGKDSLKASYAGNDVRLSYHNSVSLYNMILDASVAGTFFTGADGKTIYIDFGNGHTIDIININADRCFVKYRGDKNYNFKIGVQGAFSKFLRITSIEGASTPNSPWAEEAPQN